MYNGFYIFLFIIIIFTVYNNVSFSLYIIYLKKYIDGEIAEWLQIKDDHQMRIMLIVFFLL